MIVLARWQLVSFVKNIHKNFPLSKLYDQASSKEILNKIGCVFIPSKL